MFFKEILSALPRYELHQAVWFKPDSAEAHNNLGLVLLGSARLGESIPEFQTALCLKPVLKVAADNLWPRSSAIEFATLIIRLHRTARITRNELKMFKKSIKKS
jgi:hypothetical protein